MAYQYRSPAFNRLGTIDCEIMHLKFGWIPFTADPNDSDPDGQALFAAIVEAGGIAAYEAPALSPEQLQAAIVEAVQSRLDEFARTRRYDNILSAASYASSGDPVFASEGLYALQARDATWRALHAMLADVEAGTRPVPAGYADIENELPALTWPEGEQS